MPGNREARFRNRAARTHNDSRDMRRRVQNIWALTPQRPPIWFLGASRGQLEEWVEVLGSFHAHDEALQLFALILPDDIAAERGEFHRDFFLSHWVPRIAFGNIDTSGV